MNAAYTTARNKAITALANAEAADAQPQAQVADAAPAGPDASRNAEALKPAKLLSGATPAAVKRWVRQFEAYYEQLGAARWSVKAGHTLLTNNLDKELKAALERSPIFSETAKVLASDPTVGTSLMEILDAHFATENPVFNRRVAWYQISQSQGQTSSHVVSKIREDALLADINNLSFDESCVLWTMCAISDSELLSELRRIPQPITFQKFQDRCIAYDREKKEAQSTKKPAAAAAAPATPAPKPPPPAGGARGGGTLGGRPPIPPSMVGKCARCGDSSHSRSGCPLQPSNLQCSFGGKSGHTKGTCFTKARGGQRMAKPPPPAQVQATGASTPAGGPATPPTLPFVSGSATPPAARAQALFATSEDRVRALSTPTPKIPLVWSQQGSSFRAMATPDTGTTLTVMSSSFAPKLFTVASTWRLTAADGRQIDSSREATLRVARPRCPSKKITVLLCSDLPAGEILLAWSDQIKLSILHPEWPNPPTSTPQAAATAAAAPAVVEAAAKETAKERGPTLPSNSTASLFQEFPDVLDDNLTADKRMKGDDLKIHFKSGPVVPYHANNARPVPAHLEAPGRALCDNLIQKGVLREMDENTVTHWLARGHFVPKQGRPDQVRLVTDYIKLNHTSSAALSTRSRPPTPSARWSRGRTSGTASWTPCTATSSSPWTPRASSSPRSSSPGAVTSTPSRPWG